MKPFDLRKGVMLCVLAGIFAALLLFSKTTLEYWHFLNRSPKYYAEFAGACDELLLNRRADLPAKIIGEKLQLLPEILRSLPPSAVFIDTNRVSILVGGGGDAYHIFWVSSEQGQGLW